jgi:2-phosphosulfolactate phosphatase
MAAALAAGARELYVAGSLEEGEALRARLGDGVVMAGERKGYRIDGYDLGNSPREMIPEAVSGRTVVFNSTNGTKLLRRFAGCEHVAVGSFVCMAATVSYLNGFEADPIVCCAGTEGKFSGEDTLAAGLLISGLVKKGRECDDASDFARRLVDGAGDDWRRQAENSRHGRYLASIGLGDDLPVCTDLDRFDFVPVTAGETIVKFEMAGNG